MPLLEWEKTITCPYNPSHQITVERIQWHLVKCRKNHPASDHVVCPYNASHHVPKPEEQYHISTCSDRKIVELAKYSWAMDRPGQHGNLSMPPPSNIHWGNSDMGMEENWEKEATVKQSYDPSKKASTAPVIRNLQGATPSQRKEFRAKEKVRIETLQAGLEDSVSRSRETQQEMTTVVRPAMVRRDSAMEPLRRPTIGGQSDGVGSSRPGSVTSAILAAHLGRGAGLAGQKDGKVVGQLRRPGSLQAWGLGVDRSTDTNTTRDTLEIDTTKDTLDGVDTTADTIDMRLSQLGLGKGRGLHQLLPLRRPSGLGKM
eukprot:GFUD01034276.1.p1 GENE.GFUD01034276.1~~GFUD01034276.1.p1  ORF type:complete len:315 (+),score=112.78 GFUD01034276.1:87-1031(+)